MECAFVPAAGLRAGCEVALRGGFAGCGAKGALRWRGGVACARRRGAARMLVEGVSFDGAAGDGGAGGGGDAGGNGGDVPAAEVVIDADAQDLTPAELKARVLTLVNGSNRGAALSRAQRDKIVGLISALEGAGAAWIPPTEGADDPLVGKWRLVFTNALDVLSLAVLPFSLGQIYQNVEAPGEDDKYTVYNEVELEPYFAPVTNAFKMFPPTKSVVRVTAKGKLVGDEPASRLDITFVKSALEGITLLGRDLSRLPKLEVPLSSPVGYIETTYIDDDMRIAKAPPTPNAPATDNYFMLLREPANA